MQPLSILSWQSLAFPIDMPEGLGHSRGLNLRNMHGRVVPLELALELRQMLLCVLLRRRVADDLDVHGADSNGSGSSDECVDRIRAGLSAEVVGRDNDGHVRAGLVLSYLAALDLNDFLLAGRWLGGAGDGEGGDGGEGGEGGEGGDGGEGGEGAPAAMPAWRAGDGCWLQADLSPISFSSTSRNLYSCSGTSSASCTLRRRPIFGVGE